jgi:tetratricopeptide (TPR) repeat protein
MKAGESAPISASSKPLGRGGSGRLRRSRLAVQAFLLALPLCARASDNPSISDPIPAPAARLAESQGGHKQSADQVASLQSTGVFGELSLVTNSAPGQGESPQPAEDFQTRLEIARHHRLAQQFSEASSIYASVLQSKAPEQLQRRALVEMALMAQEENDLPRAQQIYSQYMARWPRDGDTPEILLRQGYLYRQMSLHKLAIPKFYAVLTSALTLKSEKLEKYQQLVLRAQSEIAQTQFDLGEYSDAADSINRLLGLEDPPADRSRLQYRLVHCLGALGRHQDAIAQARDFLRRYPEAPERPEVHFLCAISLKQSRQGAEALREVLSLLQEQHVQGAQSPETLAYWQRRAGNEIANRFYQEGDFLKALEIYLSLAELASAPEWQFPVWYQVGLIFERLEQPAKASEYYRNIRGREKEVSTNAPPSLKAVVEMAKWREDFLGWQTKLQLANLALRDVPPSPVKTNSP